MKLTFTGDILIYKSQDKHCRTSNGKYNYKPIFEQVKPLLDNSDYVIGSFETTTAGKKHVIHMKLLASTLQMRY